MLIASGSAVFNRHWSLDQSVSYYQRTSHFSINARNRKRASNQTPPPVTPPTNMRYLFPIAFLLICVSIVAAAEPADDAPLPAEQAARTMVVPDGFRVSLFAAEPDVKQPIGFAIDDRGRLWVAEAYSYPVHGTKSQADRIVILSDTDGNGHVPRSTKGFL